MNKYLIAIATICLLSCKENKYETEQPKAKQEISQDYSEKACNYQLPANATLLYNNSTREYVIRASDETDDYMTLYLAGMQKLVKEKQIDTRGYFGNYSRYDDGGYVQVAAPLSKAFRFKDSCLAKGAFKAFKDIERQQQIRDSISNAARYIQDSINNDFKPVK